ncbi:MAG: translation initiation factor IF-2 [Phycisphaerales bacterium]|nr:translation initiation factor IF-2 [Phycisphaerales bacterium]
MKKVRVHELAKDYGMQGKDLAKVLQDMGFEQVKSNMSALDAADLMQVEARLSTHGYRKQAAADVAAPATPKKKLLGAAAADEGEDTAPAVAAPDVAAKKELVKKALPKAPVKKTLGKKELPGEDADDLVPAHSAPAPVAAAPSAPSIAAPAPAPLAPAPAPVEPPAAAPAAAAPPAAAPAAAAPTVELPPRREPEPTPAPAIAPAAAPAPAVVAPPAPPVAPPTATGPATGPATRVAAPVTPSPATPASTPAAVPAAAAATTQPAAPGEPAKTGNDDVRRLLVPQKRATVVGRIELPQEAIRDAKMRSAPSLPGAANIKRQALAKLQQRSGTRPPMQQGGMRRPPAGPGSFRSGPGARGPGGPGGRKSRIAPSVDPSKLVEVEEPVSMKALSEALGVKVTDLLATFMFKLKITGKNINSMLTNEEVELVGLELERNIKVVEHKEAMDQLVEQLVEESEGEQQMLRAPVVTFMGHVDHGKTSLMDALRDSDVAKHEAGGITQHIGAYKITTEAGQSIVVLDTPGHAAFTAMRARGAQLTDVVVLVVAADDGVMPQTEEAINHAKAAKVKIVVAITKCDLPQAKPMQVKQQLMIKGLQSEDFGGETGMVEVSATKRTGLDTLIERILLESEMLDLRARPDAAGKGIVVESRQSPEQGVVVTLLVTDGTLRIKDQIVCGESFARVRAMIDDHGNNLTEAGPSTPVTLFGLDRLPSPGDKLFAVEDAKKAREVVEERQRRVRELSRAERSAVTLETLSAKLAEKNTQEIKLILKADAMGSLEPLKKCLEELSTPEVRVNLVHSALGGINETDVSLAEASGAVIVGFNTIADSSARQAAEVAGVEVRYYDVIYELLDQVKAAMEGLLKPQEVQNVIGHAEVKATFKSSKFGTIAGCRVTDGIVRRSAIVRLSRDSVVVWTGKLGSLRRVEEDVRDVKAGLECGMTLDGFQDIKVGDVLEFVQIELVKRTLGGD